MVSVRPLKSSLKPSFRNLLSRSKFKYHRLAIDPLQSSASKVSLEAGDLVSRESSKEPDLFKLINMTQVRFKSSFLLYPTSILFYPLLKLPSLTARYMILFLSSVLFLCSFFLFGMFSKIKELVKLRDNYDEYERLTRGSLHPGEGDYTGPGIRGSRSIFSSSQSSQNVSRDPSPPLSPRMEVDDDMTHPLQPSWVCPESEKIRTMSDLQIDPSTSLDDLMNMFKETETLEEQGDILHYLAYSKGINCDTKLGSANVNITVKDLLKDLYEKACQERKWALVRHIAGILGKRVEDLAKAITDILVRQKQVTIGMPPMNEHTITRPIPSKELREIINKAHGGDQSTAMLTQELLVFLAMFIRTEPQLFTEMLRLRVGLVIQVMVSELGRALKCSVDDASEHLLNLSPYDMKMLLHHILSGKEFGIRGG